MYVGGTSYFYLHSLCPLRSWSVEYLCLVLLWDQNSFGRSNIVLFWPNWFGLDHNDLVTTKMKWSRPKWIGLVQIVIFYQNESQFGPDQFILVVTKSLWSSPNQFGQTKTIWDRPKLFWSHRRTRHYSEVPNKRVYA